MPRPGDRLVVNAENDQSQTSGHRRLDNHDIALGAEVELRRYDGSDSSWLVWDATGLSEAWVHEDCLSLPVSDEEVEAAIASIMGTKPPRKRWGLPKKKNDETIEFLRRVRGDLDLPMTLRNEAAEHIRRLGG